MNDLELKSRKRAIYSRIIVLSRQVKLIQSILSPKVNELNKLTKEYQQLDKQLAEIDGRKKVITVTSATIETRIKNYIGNLTPSEVKALIKRLSIGEINRVIN